ncbi:MAG TPA: DUF5069 domain-containing protein [Lacunisphaera sp.]|jgi:gluconokinase
MKISGLRSDRATIGGLVFFARMLDKIRLHAQNQLPSDYNRGHGFDGRLCRFLHIDYDALVAITLAENDDAKILEWCCVNGRRPTEEEIIVFNAFLSKRGWRDDVSGWVVDQKSHMGLSDRHDIQTAFDVHDADEGRL